MMVMVLGLLGPMMVRPRLALFRHTIKGLRIMSR